MFSASCKIISAITKELKNARVIAIMSDIWTASNGDAYLGVIATYLTAPPLYKDEPYVDAVQKENTS